MDNDEINRLLNLNVDMIPAGASNRPGIIIQPSFITIHNTDNTASTADARAHARYIKGADARARQVSWHFTVDDERCIQHLPTNEMAWHAKQGNSKSIAIEICENQGINMKQALDRAALLAATLMVRLNIDLKRIVPHRFWTGKNCPHVLLDKDGGFDTFLKSVESFSTGITMELTAESASSLAEMAAARQRMVPPDVFMSDPMVTSDHSGVPPLTGNLPLIQVEDDDRIARLERLVGMLVFENQQLRESLLDAQHNTNEAN
jgi:hypothetical protein